MALAASWCDRAANASCSGRLMPSLALCRSVRAHRRLARRDLAFARLQHLAHDDVLHAVGRYACALQRRLDRQPAELGSAESAQ
jgi:hypothetical protein